MRTFAVAAIVAVIVGLVGYAVMGAKSHRGSLPNGAAATIDLSKPALAASRPSSYAEVTQLAAAVSELPPAQGLTTRPTENAMAAMRRAVDAKQHLFVFVQEKDDEQTRSARKMFDAALGKLAEQAQQFTVDRAAASESQFIEKFGLKAAPMPVILVFAPNGAIAGGFFGAQVDEQHLLESLASPAKQRCLKALQDRKLVLLCAQNETTKSNDTAMQGVNDFKADARFAEATEIVPVNPTDEAEQQFLTQLQVAPKPSEATTVFLAPPGTVVAKFTGATNKEGLVAALQKASASCSGKSGCCPPKQ